MSETKDILSLKGILEAANKIIDFSQPFSNSDDLFADKKSFDAICMNFIFIGEMSDRISDDLKKRFPEVDWKGIKGLRNVIAHNYLGVDADEIWSIIKIHLPPLILSLQKVLLSLTNS